MNSRMLIAVVVSMFVLCQQIHAQAQDEPDQAEATELEGTWELVSRVRNGEQNEIDNQFVRFEGNRSYHRTSDDGDWTHDGTFSVDPSAMPAQIDFVATEINDTNIELGIYDIDGDSLRICIGRPRPDRFESTEDYRTELYVLHRVEEDDE